MRDATPISQQKGTMEPAGARAAPSRTAFEIAALGTAAGGMALGAAHAVSRAEAAERDASAAEIAARHAQEEADRPPDTTEAATHEPSTRAENAADAAEPGMPEAGQAFDQAAIDTIARIEAALAAVGQAPPAPPDPMPQAPLDASAPPAMAGAGAAGADPAAAGNAEPASLVPQDGSDAAAQDFVTLGPLGIDLPPMIGGGTDFIGSRIETILAELPTAEGLIERVSSSLDGFMDPGALVEEAPTGLAGLAGLPVELLGGSTDDEAAFWGAPGEPAAPLSGLAGLAQTTAAPVASAVEATSPFEAVAGGGGLDLGFLGQSYLDTPDPMDIGAGTMASGLHGLI